MNKNLTHKLFELVKMAYWSNATHCGGDFNEELCCGGDNGSCRHHDFCRLSLQLDIDLAAIAGTEKQGS